MLREDFQTNNRYFLGHFQLIFQKFPWDISDRGGGWLGKQAHICAEGCKGGHHVNFKLQNIFLFKSERSQITK